MMAHVLVRHPSGALRAPQSAVLPIGQRFGSALNLNIHFYMLFLDGMYVTTGERLAFRRVPSPTVAALEKLVHLTVLRRTCRSESRVKCGEMEGSRRTAHRIARPPLGRWLPPSPRRWCAPITTPPRSRGFTPGPFLSLGFGRFWLRRALALVAPFLQ